MTSHVLDHPIWSSLAGPQAHFALGTERVKRYAADVAPFLAVDPDARDVAAECAEVVVAGEVLSLVGHVPELPAHWQVAARGKLLQMAWEGPAVIEDVEPVGSLLTCDDAGAMLGLTAVAFPGYFRARTCEMGTYLGIRVNDQLVAMAGERLACGSFREVSGVCTHPDFVGQGFARQLVSEIVNGILATGLTPFLHVDLDNQGAIRIYEKLGFTRRAALDTCRVVT